MEHAILNTVFEAEREIREMAAAEQQQTDGHLADVHQECSDLAAREEVSRQFCTISGETAPYCECHHGKGEL